MESKELEAIYDIEQIFNLIYDDEDLELHSIDNEGDSALSPLAEAIISALVIVGGFALAIKKAQQLMY